MNLFTADYIFNGEAFFRNAVLVLNDDGSVQDFFPSAERSQLEAAKKFSGTLSPGFINAHCHLELSHMTGKVTPGKGFAKFATELIPQRNWISPEQIAEVCAEADAEMYACGIQAVGDISNVDFSFAVKADSKIAYHTFIELLGLNPAVAQKMFEEGKKLKAVAPETKSLSPHAPYSVSAELLRLIAREEEIAGGVITIHNQESRAESEFTEHGTGSVLEIFKMFGLDLSFYKPSGKNSLHTVLPELLGSFNLLLVHNTFSSASDIQWAHAQHEHLYWCLCPNANLYIERSLPDVMMMRENNCRLVIGTDSLASNQQLSILEELKVLHKNFPGIPVAELLTWATSNGAEALKLVELGAFFRGRKPGVVLLSDCSKESLGSTSTVSRII
jgi:cytosine/adenosine deaminase-related metal-dependent hydrolase